MCYDKRVNEYTFKGLLSIIIVHIPCALHFCDLFSAQPHAVFMIS